MYSKSTGKEEEKEEVAVRPGCGKEESGGRLV